MFKRVESNTIYTNRTNAPITYFIGGIDMGIEVYQCHTGSSLKKLFSKNDSNRMFLQIDDTQGSYRITGKAYIANEEGKNEYIAQYEYLVKDIISVEEIEFMGGNALSIYLKVPSVYGSKKVKVIVPNLGASLGPALQSVKTRVAEAKG